MTQKKPLTNEEINAVGWFCKNSQKLRLFLDGKYLQNMDVKDPSPEYVVGGVFYGEYAESSVPPPGRKEVEFTHNNLYWKEDVMETPDPSKTTHSPTVYSELYWTMGILEGTNLQEDVREEFLHHLSCLLGIVRKNL